MPNLAWGDVEPLPHINGDIQSVLAAVDSLKSAWCEVVKLNTDGFREARTRSLRRHAIETGIIERLYEVDWGVTEALVAEGLTAEAAARAETGTVDENVLVVIRSQYEALEFLSQMARESAEPLTVYRIKELHAALTRTQGTYWATAPNGMRFEASLHHGQWKESPNHVTRPDGSVLEYTVPEQVQPQMERLVDLYNDMADAHPIVRCAWLHHRFVRIHPFEDGNGRVARGLTLLTLLSGDLAPLVVDRRERERYIGCLDKANEGDLRPLVRFFAELEIVALRSELERPAAGIETADSGGARAVLDAHIARLRSLRDEEGAQERGTRVAALAEGVHDRVVAWLQVFAADVESSYRSIDPHATARVAWSRPPEEKARWWRRQVVKTARSVDFYVNLASGVWWTQLRVDVLGQRLRYLVFLQKVGHGETGVLAATIYAEIVGESSDEDGDIAEQVAISSPTESVTWMYKDQDETHWDQMSQLLDDSLAAVLDRFSTRLS